MAGWFRSILTFIVAAVFLCCCFFSFEFTLVEGLAMLAFLGVTASLFDASLNNCDFDNDLSFDAFLEASLNDSFWTYLMDCYFSLTLFFAKLFTMVAFIEGGGLDDPISKFELLAEVDFLADGCLQVHFPEGCLPHLRQQKEPEGDVSSERWRAFEE